MLKPFLQILISWGPWGLLLLAVLDSLGIPIVGGVDALLIAVSTVEPQQAYLGAVCAILGSVIGSYILFAIARKGGHVMLAGRRRTARDCGSETGLSATVCSLYSSLPCRRFRCR